MKREYIGVVGEDYIKDVETTFHLGIIGSRSFPDYTFFQNQLYGLIALLDADFDIPSNKIVFVSGGAVGADSMAERYANENGFDILVIKPDWKKDGRRAGFSRNSEIVKYSDHLFAFVDKPTGGSYDTIKKARKKGMMVNIIDYYQQDSPSEISWF